MFICQVLCTGMQGKYHLSELKSLIVIWVVFLGGLGVLRGLHLTSLQCWLAVYYPNYSEITGNSHLFWKNPKWLPNLSHNIYPMMHLGVGDKSARRSAKISFNNNITYYTWQIWVLIVDICNCHVGGVLGMFWGCFRGVGVSRKVTSDMTVQC